MLNLNKWLTAGLGLLCSLGELAQTPSQNPALPHFGVWTAKDFRFHTG